MICMNKFRKYFAGVSVGTFALIIAVAIFTGNISPDAAATKMVVDKEISNEVESVNVPYRLTKNGTYLVDEFVNSEKAEVEESDMLKTMNEVSIAEASEPKFPFETDDLGIKKIIANTDRDNKSGSKNFDGMTVTINPKVVPYGGIVYIEELGFRYNQPSDYSPNCEEIYLYFNTEEEVSTWNNQELKVYRVHNKKEMDMTSEYSIDPVNKGKFHITAYCPCAICCEEYADDPEGKVGSKETNVYQGTTIASDPSVLPYGTVVYIEHVGIRFVADCGGAINQKDIDLYFIDHGAAWNFGVKNYNVWVLQ